MTQKIAIAMIHGMGKQTIDYAANFSKTLTDEFIKKSNKAGLDVGSNPLIFKLIYWAPIVETIEEQLWQKIHTKQMNYTTLRRFIVSYIGDAIAYNPSNLRTNGISKLIYRDIQIEFFKVLNQLSQEAGAHAPLYIISHSLGTVIASNLVYDLQKCHINSGSPVVNGELFTSFYTLGSPMALWALRYQDFGYPIRVPSTHLTKHYSHLQGEWLNFYHKNDVLSYPLKGLNKAYQTAVSEDIDIKRGPFLLNQTPLAHLYYFKSKLIRKRMVDSLLNTWRTIN